MYRIIFLSVLFCVLSSVCQAEVRLPVWISDGMVLQRDTENKIWGWADANEKIQVCIDKQKHKIQANANGEWSVILEPLQMGRSHTLEVKGSNKIKVEDVLIGDVYLCSGQSNMVLYMERLKEKYPEEVANADNPNIRHFFIPTTTSLIGPADDLPQSSWKKAIRDEIMSFSGVAYFFAKDIYEKTGVPIGLINASVGGTPIESWISESGFREFPDILELINQNKDEEYVKKQNEKVAKSRTIRPNEDQGMLSDIKWYENDYEPKGWRKYTIPGFWEDQGLRDLNGVIWFRKEVEVPSSYLDREVNFYMGRIVDADEIYVNGEKIGNITYQYPPRRYVVPAGVFRKGKNTITIRVTNYGGKGGFVPDKPYFITDGTTDTSLSGDWEYKVGQVFAPAKRGYSFSAQNQPSSLYNAMIAPLVRTSIKGMLWYQGESNSGRPWSYYDYLPALIHDWREQWEDDSLPFYYVQLANFMEEDFLPRESSWARLRDAQLSGLEVSDSYMAVTIDLGEWNDIHPLNKEDIGKRLARAALYHDYGYEDMVYIGPIVSKVDRSDDEIVLSFDHVGDGLRSSDGDPLRYFALGSEDGGYTWVDAQISSSDEITIQLPSDRYVTHLRFAWMDNPAQFNLYNSAGLPASPFEVAIPALSTDGPWKGKKCAVVLTYDDALTVHLDNAIPKLDEEGLKATFYINGFFPGSMEHIEDWRRAAARGHELGNHTLYHPCDGTKPGRDWIQPGQDLSEYTLSQLIKEIRMTSVFLEAVDGQQERTFAYTCGDMDLNGYPFMKDLEGDFVAARSVSRGMKTVTEHDLYDVDSYSVEGHTAEEMISWVEQAREENKLIVFLFHGVGGGHGLNVELEEHHKLIDYLSAHQDDIWVDTMLEVAKYIKEKQGE